MCRILEFLQETERWEVPRNTGLADWRAGGTGGNIAIGQITGVRIQLRTIEPPSQDPDSILVVVMYKSLLCSTRSVGCASRPRRTTNPIRGYSGKAAAKERTAALPYCEHSTFAKAGGF